MNELHLSTTTKKLLSAAKTDVPSAAARAKVWAGVSGAVGGAAGATAITANSLLGGGASAAKVAALGALFGGAITVGLAATLLHIGAVPLPSQVQMVGPPGAGRPGVVVVPAEPAVAPRPEPAALVSETGNTPALAAPAATKRSHPPSRSRPAAHEDALGREASLVSHARSSLGRGDPRAALQAVRAARALPSHQLDPEELAVEEQALRALGRSDEANGIEVQLRLEYPEADLAR